MSLCPDCNGAGVILSTNGKDRFTCWTCNGNGNDTWKDFLAIKAMKLDTKKKD